jgi:hypothetical protein
VTVRDELAARGYAVVPAPARTTDDAWAYVHELVGERPEMVERQPIRPVGGRSFASSSAFTPFHTDSQDYRGGSPGLQVMVCRRAARAGGETRLVDGWALIDRIARTDPALHEALTRTPRRHRFYFGDVIAPSVCERRGQRAWTHSPMPPGDAIGVALARELDREPVIEVAVATGEVLVVDNHRMLHGRAAFDDRERDFVRFLAWMPARTCRELAVVIEMMTGVPPARLAEREGVTEAELYRWRTLAMDAAEAALER